MFELLFLGFLGATGAGLPFSARAMQDAEQGGQGGYGYQPQYAPQHPHQYAPPIHRAIRQNGQEARIRKSGKGFYATCRIADVAFVAMIDTGASDCIISHDVVRRLGIDPRGLRVNKSYSLASGQSVPATVLPLPIEVQGIAMEDVEVAIVHGMPGDNLIGMSFLGRLYGYEVMGSTMILRA